MIRNLLLATAAAAVLASGPVARAGGGVDASLDAALREARAHVAAERWIEGEAALRKYLSDRPGDPRVRARLRQIEEDLELCLFRQHAKTPDAKSMFGAALRRFLPSTLEVELEYARPEGPEWVAGGAAATFFAVEFDGDAAIEFVPVTGEGFRASRLVVLVLCEADRGTGYAVVPYLAKQYESQPASVAVRFAPSGIDVVAEQSCDLDSEPDQAIAVSRIDGALALRRGKKIAFAVSHGRRATGLVGVLGAEIRDVKLRGRLRASSFQRMVADRLTEEFRRWREEDYDRTREIPAWARIQFREDSDDTLGLLPLDGRYLAPEQTEEIVRLVLSGTPDGYAWGAGVAAASSPVTTSYFNGLLWFARGDWARARPLFDWVLTQDPEFVTGLLFRGVTLSRLNDFAGARRDLGAVLAKRPRALRAHLELARMAMVEFEYDRALAWLNEAAALGGYGPELDDLSGWVHRAVEGPLWPKRFRRESRNFVVESDLSEKTCADVAATLEEMQSVYATALGQVAPAPAKSRVYVFASEDGYRRHTVEIGAYAESSAGLYSPMLRTLLLFVPASPADLTATVRHEGFHQYLSRMLREPPAWLDEGWAQVVQGTPDVSESNAILRAVFGPRFLPVRRLVELEHAEFMKDAAVHYAQSRLLVGMLLGTRNPKLSGVLKRYLAALRAGSSHQQAIEAVLTPVMDALETEFAVSLR